MKTSFNLITLGLLGVLIISLSSCLKHDLPDYPLWDGNDITNVYVEYRFNTSEDHGGDPVVGYQRLDVSQTIDEAQGNIALVITVPTSGGAFTDEIRNQVTQNKLWIYFDLSTAATIKAVGDTPVPGNSTDLTVPQSYEVTAANGSKRVWTVEVTSFNK